MTLDAPFPWFGGKRRVAAEVWRRFGNVPNYVEPFFGSGAVLLGRPHAEPGIETVNDLDGYVANFWRAVKAEPERVAEHADWPVNENDLHARHIWLVHQRETLRASLEGNPEFYDVKIAGWWVWGMACWIGGEFCSGKGPWQLTDAGQLVHLGDAGRGVQRQLVHLGDAGQGVQRKRVQLTHAGKGVNRPSRVLIEWFGALADRLRRVRVCSGDWSRICGPTPTIKQGLTGVFLDPPYADTANRDSTLYRVDSESVAHDVREWAIANGDNPLMRIALCGYEGEHVMPDSWRVLAWKAKGGYANQGAKIGENAKRERIWFSPACLEPEKELFTP